MSTSWIVFTVMENELIYFGLFGLAVAGFLIYFGYLLRNWSWMPRKKHERVFIERF